MIKTLISFALIIVALFFHSYNLTTIPSGLYLDETSIGINAGNIAQHGVDEYGKSFPLYFEAFGEWKNPLYIYVSAGIMKFFGISDFTLRVTSVFFFGIFLWGVYLFVSEIFKNTKYKNFLLYFALISASVLPWFFTLSRVAFEVISQLSTGIFVLYFLYKYYVSEKLELNTYSKYFIHVFGVLSGVSLGLFLYSYSTSKLIAFGIVFALFISFFEKKYWKKHCIVLASFGVFLLPYLYFSYTHSGALSARFELLTYLYNPDFSVIEKISIFLKNYFSSYDISNFLLFEGDKNLRHATGFMGQIFFVPFVLFIIGICKIVSDILNTEIKNIKNIKNIGKLENKKYKLFLLILLLGAPIASSLTTDLHHSLRLLFFGCMIFVFSLYGADIIFQKYNRVQDHIKSFYIFLVLLFPLLFQSYFYFSDYFDTNSGYAKRAIPWFDGNKFEKHVQISLSSSGDKILFENPNDPFYANVDFYNMQITESPIIMTKKSSVISTATCVIVPRKNIKEFRQVYKTSYKTVKNNMKPVFVTDLFTTYCIQ